MELLYAAIRCNYATMPARKSSAWFSLLSAAFEVYVVIELYAIQMKVEMISAKASWFAFIIPRPKGRGYCYIELAF